jgi:hypothetical protein
VRSSSLKEWAGVTRYEQNFWNAALAGKLDGGWIMDPKDLAVVGPPAGDANSYLTSPSKRQMPLKNAACWNGLEAVYIFLTVGGIDVTKPRSYVPFG